MKKLLLALVALTLPLAAQAQLYPLFGPATGLLKGSVSTPQTTAAVATDVAGLFCGTSTTNFLRADGTCNIPPGVAPSGAANQMFATPNGSSGSASLRALVGADVPPINLASTANGGVTSILPGANGGTNNGFFSVTGPTTSLKTFTYPNASATVLTDNAAVTVPQGGTGRTTLTNHGVLLGAGTGGINAVAAMAADTLLQGLGTGSDPGAVAVNNCGSSTQALSYSTSTHTFGCQTISVGGTGTVTSLTGGVGVTASPATITTTGSFAVDQSFSPTWTGTHTYSLAPAFNAGFTGSGSSAGLGIRGLLTNTLASTNNRTGFIFNNDVPTNLTLGITSSAQTSPVFTNGPAAPHMYLGNDGTALTGNNYPLSVGTNGVERVRVSGVGAVTINTPTGVVALTVTGANNNNTLQLTGGATSGQSFGAIITAGTTTADAGLRVRDATGTNTHLLVRGDGSVMLPTITTTASAANAFIDNANSNNILRATSSRRYKRDIGDLLDAERVVMHLRPVKFHSLAAADNPNAWYYGLVAEEVATLEPSLVNYDKYGRPDGVQYDRVQVWMLPMVQAMRWEVWGLMVAVTVLLVWNVWLTVKIRRGA